MARRSKKKREAGGLAPKGERQGEILVPAGRQSFAHDWAWGMVLVVAVFVVYSPVWWAGFIWDDDTVVATNPVVVGPLGLLEIWTTRAADICPLTLTTFWIEHALWGLAPVPYHLVNVLLHAACAILLWRVLRSLEIPGAWLGAALWALHPVEVESVAWVAEMKNTESALFFLLSILFFLRWVKDQEMKGRAGAGRDYVWTLLFAAMAMASKSSTVVLPVVLGLCAWWVQGRWQWRNLRIIGPAIAMAMAASALAIWTQSGVVTDGTAPLWQRPWSERLGTASEAVWFYLGKLIWPHPLITIYPGWQAGAVQSYFYLPLLAVIVVLSIFYIKRETWGRPCFFASAYFLSALLPVLGLAGNPIFRFAMVFDHLQYLASMGPLALAGAGVVRLSDVIFAQNNWLRGGLAAGLLLVLAVLSWQRAWVYENAEVFWADLVAKSPDCWLAYNNLGNALIKEGDLDRAIPLVQTALRLNPHYDRAYCNLGEALFKEGKFDNAIDAYKEGLLLNPGLADAHTNLGDALNKKGERDEAIAEYEKALEIEPYNVEAHNNLGMALYQMGQMDDAVSEFRAVLKIDPTYIKGYNNLGFVMFKTGRVDEAIEQYRKALEIAPNYANALNDLGVALLQKGDVDGAIVQFQKVLAQNPNDSTAQNYLNKAEAMTLQNK